MEMAENRQDTTCGTLTGPEKGTGLSHFLLRAKHAVVDDAPLVPLQHGAVFAAILQAQDFLLLQQFFDIQDGFIHEST
jgi:hypothetical protein